MAQGLPTIQDPEAYAVYAALFQRQAKNDPDFARNIRLLQETRRPITRCGQKGYPERGWEPAMSKFWQVNAHRWLLTTGADLGMPYTLITPPMIESILKAVAQDLKPRLGGGPEPGLRMLPARYIALSAVGFNVEKTFALVGGEWGCDRLNTLDHSVGCTKGNVSAFEKIGGQWILSPNANSCFWIY